MTNMSMEPKLGRNQRNKQRQKERMKKVKKEIYKGWVQFDHKLRGLQLQNYTQHSEFHAKLMQIVKETTTA